MVRIDVRCAPAAGTHRCEVDVVEERSTTRHAVEVSKAELDRWGRGRSAEELVRDSFRFLLEREANTAILPSFALPLIGQYFPEFEKELPRYLERLTGSLRAQSPRLGDERAASICDERG